MRTTILIDDELMEKAKAASGLRTKREVVEQALRTLIRVRRQEDILKLRGKIRWEGKLDEMRGERRSDAGPR